MKTLINTTQTSDFLDLLFLNKNKAYGAYFLRKIYPSHLKRSLILGVLFFVFLLSLPMIIGALSPHDPVQEKVSSVIILRRYESKKPVTKKPLETKTTKPQKANPASKKFPTMVITKDDLVNDKAPVVEDISINTGIEDVKADLTTYLPQEYVNIEEATSTEEEEEVLKFAEQEPSFPGGQEALMKFLSEIKFPGLARANNITGKVILRFVVNKFGEVEDIKVVRGVGFGLDEAAIKRVQQMPKWIPGKQNGKAVSVLFTLPINFVLKN